MSRPNMTKKPQSKGNLRSPEILEKPSLVKYYTLAKYCFGIAKIGNCSASESKIDSCFFGTKTRVHVHQ